MKQREAVFKAVTNVMGEVDGKYQPTTEQRKSIVQVVALGIAEGKVDFSDEARAKYHSLELIEGYTRGLVNNWLRKDTRLNGNTKYVPANPGTRTGQGDPEIKNLRLLLKSGKLNEAQSELCQARLDSKLAEIQANKAKNVEIDFSVLPEDLVAELGITE